LTSGAAHAVQLDGAARLWLGGGLDTNPTRDFVTPGDKTPTDAVLQGVLQLDGALSGERGVLLASYDLGGRKFILNSSEDTLIQGGSIEGELYLLPQFTVGADFRVRDRRGAARDYTDVAGDGTVRLLIQNKFDAKFRVGAHRFLYRPNFPYSYSGPDFGLNARYRFNRKHSVFVSLDSQPRTFNGYAQKDPDDPPDPDNPDPPPVIRKDTFFSVSAGYQYRGPWAFGFSYTFFESDSNSFGETLRSHRFEIHVGTRLFWEISLLGTAAFQWVQYPNGRVLPADPTSTDPGILTVDGDETGPQVSLKLTRPLGKHFEIDFGWNLYFDYLALGDPPGTADPSANDLYYLRNTFTLGIAFRVGSDQD
jgi:hypothetical protein